MEETPFDPIEFLVSRAAKHMGTTPSVAGVILSSNILDAKIDNPEILAVNFLLEGFRQSPLKSA